MAIACWNKAQKSLGGGNHEGDFVCVCVACLWIDLKRDMCAPAGARMEGKTRHRKCTFVLLDKAQFGVLVILAKSFLGRLHCLVRLGLECHDSAVILDFLEKDVRHVRLE